MYPTSLGFSVSFIKTMASLLILNFVGDLYIKQEFRLHLDKASDDQMDKFMV
jgi:hypothetical protein